MKVCKFGGSSVADASQIMKVKAILDSDKERTIVVVSAPGKRFSGDEKVTDMLLSCSELSQEDMDTIASLNKALPNANVLAHIKRLAQGIPFLKASLISINGFFSILIMHKSIVPAIGGMAVP